MEERHAEEQIGSGFCFEQQIAYPRLINLVAVGMADKLRCAGGTAGVKVGRDVFAGNTSAADKPVGRLLLDEFAEGINLLRRITRAVDLHDGFEALELASYPLHFLPDIRAGRGAERNKNGDACGFQDFRDLMRFQNRIDGIGDASRFRTKQGHKGLGQQRKQEAYHVTAANAEDVKHVGGLRHTIDEIAIGHDDWFIVRVGIGEKLDSGGIEIVGGAQLDGIIGALGGNTVCVRSLFEGTDIDVSGEARIFVAYKTIEQVYADHIRCLPYVSFSRRINLLYGFGMLYYCP